MGAELGAHPPASGGGALGRALRAKSCAGRVGKGAVRSADSDALSWARSTDTSELREPLSRGAPKERLARAEGRGTGVSSARRTPGEVVCEVDPREASSEGSSSACSTVSASWRMGYIGAGRSASRGSACLWTSVTSLRSCSTVGGSSLPRDDARSRPRVERRRQRSTSWLFWVIVRRSSSRSARPTCMSSRGGLARSSGSKVNALVSIRVGISSGSLPVGKPASSSSSCVAASRCARSGPTPSGPTPSGSTPAGFTPAGSTVSGRSSVTGGRV